MEDFCYAGGLPAVMKEIQQFLQKDILTVSGKSVAEMWPAPKTTIRV
jgi:dihydroxy-acid dehydratase